MPEMPTSRFEVSFGILMTQWLLWWGDSGCGRKSTLRTLTAMQVESEFFSNSFGSVWFICLRFLKFMICLSVCPSHSESPVLVMDDHLSWLSPGFRYIVHCRATRIEGGLNPGAGGEVGAWLEGYYGLGKRSDYVTLKVVISYQSFFVENPSCTWKDDF